MEASVETFLFNQEQLVAEELVFFLFFLLCPFLSLFGALVHLLIYSVIGNVYLVFVLVLVPWDFLSYRPNFCYLFTRSHFEQI